MFGMGLTLSPSDFKILGQHPKSVLAGVVAQFVIMPLTAYVLAVTLQLPPAIAAGVILVGACPGGTASNVMTFLARANVALSVAVTSVSTLLAPVLTPAIFYLLAIEVGMQNSGLAAGLAMKYFDPIAAVPGAIFSVWHNISGSLLASYWAAKAAKEERRGQEGQDKQAV